MSAEVSSIIFSLVRKHSRFQIFLESPTGFRFSLVTRLVPKRSNHHISQLDIVEKKFKTKKKKGFKTINTYNAMRPENRH